MSQYPKKTDLIFYPLDFSLGPIYFKFESVAYHL
jgi:hypothetical protein